MIRKWLAGFLCLLLFAGCAAADTKPTGTYEQIDITVDELEQKIADKETFLLLTEREECPFCEALNEYIEATKEGHAVTVYRLDTTDMGFQKLNAEDKTLISQTEEGKQFLELQPYFLYTPAIYKYENGKAQTAAIGWNTTTEQVSVWDTGSTIDFTSAQTMDVWDFLEE